MHGTPRNVPRAEVLNPDFDNKWVNLPADVPSPPDWLNDVGREEFERVVETLKEAQILTKVDTSMLAAYCQTYSQYRELNRNLLIQGYIMENGRENPLCKVLARVLTQMTRLAQQFGLSPRGRSLIKPNSKGEINDDLDSFLDT